LAVYTKITNTIVERLISQYGLGLLYDMEPLAGGQANSSIKIKTETGFYILSICDEKSQSEIKLLTTLLDYLEEYDFSTTRVVKTDAGSSLIEYEEKPVYIKEYIEGKVFDHLDEGKVYQLGEKLAQLHEIPPHRELADQHSYGIECFYEVFQAPLKGDFGHWLKEKTQYLNRTLKLDLPKGFIHGDLFYDNTLYQDETLVAILDFEEACHYYRIFDLGMCAIGACVRDGFFSLILLKALIAGYETVRRLEQAEKEQLQVNAEYAAIATAFWRFRQYHARNPIKEKADAHLEMKLLADQVHEIPSGFFSKTVFNF